MENRLSTEESNCSSVMLPMSASARQQTHTIPLASLIVSLSVGDKSSYLSANDASDQHKHD